MTFTDDDTPAFMNWPLPSELGTPDPYYGETEAHLWQVGRCGICGVHQEKCSRRHALDHDHDTGLVRGLLCTGCNLQEGWSPNILFRRWKSGMNPCAIFGWHYYHRGASAPLPITAAQASLLESRAAEREAELKRLMLQPMPNIFGKEVIGGGVPTDQDQHAAQPREYLEEPHMTTTHHATTEAGAER